MIIKYFLLFTVGAGLLACSSVKKINAKGEKIEVNNSTSNNSKIDSLTNPYKEDLDKEMGEIIAFAENDLLVERPCGLLNNWVADALLYSVTKKARLEAPTFCLLNTGGIRSSINKGNVTLGDMFKVMPFDNYLMWVKMPISSIPSIEKYLINSGGEPISGALLEKGKLLINGLNEKSTHFWIITSDYLLNGGDKMTFFEQKISANSTDVLMRDALISVAKEQKILVKDSICRISF